MATQVVGTEAHGRRFAATGPAGERLATATGVIEPRRRDHTADLAPPERTALADRPDLSVRVTNRLA
jgi:hypothetical protein